MLLESTRSIQVATHGTRAASTGVEKQETAAPNVYVIYLSASLGLWLSATRHWHCPAARVGQGGWVQLRVNLIRSRSVPSRTAAPAAPLCTHVVAC